LFSAGYAIEVEGKPMKTSHLFPKIEKTKGLVAFIPAFHLFLPVFFGRNLHWNGHGLP
jgi:hypothetical protein